VSRSIVTGHQTFSTFLSMPLDGLQRWQSASRVPPSSAVRRSHRFVGGVCATAHALRPHWTEFVLIVTLVIEQLLVNIWMCAAAARARQRATAALRVGLY
jgi:hypothetical protein